MKKTITHYYRDQMGVIRPYYIAIVEPLPCPYCSGRIKIPKCLKTRFKKKKKHAEKKDMI